MILISACLLGENCKYSGGNNRCEAVLRYLGDRPCIPFCPEQSGGLPTPRCPAEIRNGHVVTIAGEDVTAAFRLGAENTLRVCRENDVTLAVLKQSSPSCGTKTVYDGTFTGKKLPGMGVTARLLSENGITVIGEDDL